MMSAVLSDTEIKKEISEGNIVLYDPENTDIKKNINNCSVDITLGDVYYRNSEKLNFLNPWCEEHVRKYWGKPIKAESVNSQKESDDFKLDIGRQYILLNPGESILGHTREFIGGRNHITTMIKCRSSLGRNNITICRDAGWGDINFYNRWCLEITNNGTSTIILPVGCRIGQVVFLYTGKCENPYNGKYHTFNEARLEETVRNWNPEMLLPKLHLEQI